MTGDASKPDADASEMRRAVLEGDLDTVLALIDRGVPPDLVIGRKRSRRETNRDIDPAGFTALHVAAYEDDGALTTLLLERGAGGTHPSGLGWLPVELAASWRSPSALRALLEAGVDPNAPSRFGGPLALAAAGGDATLVEMLLAAGANRGMAHAIANACSANGDADILRLLLAAGGAPPRPDPTSTAWSVRVTALYYRKWDCLALLDERTTPETLIDAAIDGDVDRVATLVAAGHDVRRRLDYDITALFCAATMGHAKVVNRLIDAGADVDAKTRVKGTPLTAALVRGYIETANVLVTCGASTSRLEQSLLGTGCPAAAWDWAFAHGEDEDLDTLLSRAVSRVDASAVAALLARGADPNGRTGHPHLMHATWTGSTAIVRALLGAGADPLAVDREGRPIMHYVLQYDDVTLEGLDSTDYDRNSPMLRSEAVRMLLDAGAPLPWDID